MITFIFIIFRFLFSLGWLYDFFYKTGIIKYFNKVGVDVDDIAIVAEFPYFPRSLKTLRYRDQMRTSKIKSCSIK